MNDLIDAIPDICKNLAEEIDFEEYGNARISMRQLSDALEQLSKKIGATADADEHNSLVDLHTAAREQWLNANAKLREAGEEWQ